MATNIPINHQHEPTINIQPVPASVWKPTRFGWPKHVFSLKPASRKQQGLICTVLSGIELHQHPYEHYGVGNCVLDDSHQPMGLSKHRVFCEPTLTFDICCLPADFHLWHINFEQLKSIRSPGLMLCSSLWLPFGSQTWFWKTHICRCSMKNSIC